MTAEAHRFAIEIQRGDGSLVGAADASVAPCLEDAWFRGVQEGRLDNDGQPPSLRVAPIWHASERPAVTGLSVGLYEDPPQHYAREVFEPQAQALIRRFVEEERLAKGSPVYWRVVALDEELPAASARAAATRVTRSPFPLEPAPLPHVTPGASETCFDAALLRRLQDRVARAGTVELAALLLGQLRHDAARRALELHVVDEIPLEPGKGGASNLHFSFAPGSFIEARRAAQARQDGALPCGWLHTHTPCASCRANPACEVDWVFFSADDVQVHASLFASPHMIAVVAGKVGHLPATRPGFRLYGWRDARVQERAFRLEGPGAEHWSAEDGSFGDEKES